MPSMSDLGLTTSGAKRNEDEERRAKMRRVLKSIGRPKGRVSEEGIARIARRVGFQNDIDAEKLTAEEKERRVGNRTIMTAGNTVVVEIDLRDQTPQTVQVTYGQNKASIEHGQIAGKVLMDDLKAPDGIALDAKLDRFAMNLENLAKLDRLSAGGITSFEALGGIYTSLRRLYDNELAGVRERTKSSVAKADTEVMCKASGRPLVHARGRFGFELAYWRDGRYIGPQPGSNDAVMDIDDSDQANADLDEDQDDVFTLRLEVEPSPAGVYPSLRVSDSWLNGYLDPAVAEFGKDILWQDPPATLVSSISGTGGTETMPVDGQQKLPDLRFVARLEPPIVMPYQVAMNVLTTVGVSVPTTLTIPPQYAALLLDPAAVARAQQSIASFSMAAEHAVLSQENERESTIEHRYALNSVKPDWGFKIEELPFSHPRQLVELLPTLRQWACIGSLLKSTFKHSASSTNDRSMANGTQHAKVQKSRNGSDNPVHINGNSSLEDLLTPPGTPRDGGTSQINISLTTSPIPTLGFTFPERQHSGIGNVNVQILPNADLVVTSKEDVDGDATDSDSTEERKKLARALDVCGDVGVWIEWMRKQS